MIVKLDDYRKQNLHRKADSLLRDAQALYEASVHLALAAIELQMAFLKSLR